jgi:two-component system, chemotaxis family, CheB/CheR fusion protein
MTTKKEPVKEKNSLQDSSTSVSPVADGFPIVGMGASAGGLEAFESFFTAMPEDSGMAFVLVSHLDPTHISILPELIQKKTQMKVHQVTDGMQIQPNMIYVIPPNKDMAILNGTLHLMGLPHPRGFNLPIDSFFKSLAQDRGTGAIGIILSGTGSDGSLGLKQIKGELGMVMVQDEDSAKYAGMPKSAVATGLVDYVLPADKMPEALIKYTRHAIAKPRRNITGNEEKMQTALQKIYILLRTHTGHDFSLYKKNTIIRRVERRMHVHQIDNIQDYLTYLAKSEREIHVLFKDLLIGVTGFFRDPEAFDILKDKYLPELLADKPDGTMVRVWVPGCSTGEEAYSMAMLLQECMERMHRHFNVQIFATDIDPDAIDIARAGLYPFSIAADVGPKRVKRFFTKEENHYKIKKNIREMLVFALQDLIKDPPFTKLDIISCRNLLIYLGPELQKKLFPVFHYSLKPDGLLFIGSSESMGQETTLFAIADRKFKIFKPNPGASTVNPILNTPVSASSDDFSKTQTPEAVKRAEDINNFKLVETILQQSDMPPCVIIDEKLNIVYIHGRTGKYLEPAPGRACFNILDMARPSLKTVLASAIRKTAITRQEVVREGVDIEENGGFIKIDLTVKPVLAYGSLRGMLMVIFNDIRKAKTKAKPRATQTDNATTRLEQELQYTKENLQTTIEELETANEELKSTNEELQSTNEELQSTNEEMETSKEELQSLNEESATVNAQLQSRVGELSDANDDMKNLFNSTHIGTIFLDMDMNIRRFTDMVTDLIPLTMSDIGRPVNHFATTLKEFHMVAHARKVLKDLITREFEVESYDHKFFRTRITPYRTTQNVIDGVVVTFEDITEFRRYRLTAERLSVIMNSKEAVLIQDKKGNILFWNQGAVDMYGYTESEALKMNIKQMIPEDKRQESQALIDNAFTGKLFDNLETERVNRTGKTQKVWVMVLALRDEKDLINGIVTIERTINGTP